MKYRTRAYERLLSARGGSGFYAERTVSQETTRYEVNLPATWSHSYVAPWVNCVPGTRLESTRELYCGGRFEGVGFGGPNMC